MSIDTEPADELQVSESADTQSALVFGTQVIAGALAKPVENPVKALGVVVQRILQRDLLGGLQEGMDFLAKEGRVKPDYFNTSKGRATFQELLKVLSEDSINEERFKAARAIFLNAALGGEKVGDTVLVTTLMQIVNRLSTSEIVTLKAVWQFWQQYDSAKPQPERWSSFLSQRTGLTYELVEEDVSNLAKHRLLSESAQHRSRRLTNTGGKLCDYLIDPTSRET